MIATLQRTEAHPRAAAQASDRPERRGRIRTPMEIFGPIRAYRLRSAAVCFRLSRFRLENQAPCVRPGLSAALCSVFRFHKLPGLVVLRRMRSPRLGARQHAYHFVRSSTAGGATLTRAQSQSRSAAMAAGAYHINSFERSAWLSHCLGGVCLALPWSPRYGNGRFQCRESSRCGGRGCS